MSERLSTTNKTTIRLVSAIVGLSLLAGCVTPPPPPPPPTPPPPAPVVEVKPPRPTAPGSAALGMYIPPRGSDGLRQTVNYGLTNNQTLWNFRSAMNVASLNCLDARYSALKPSYRALLSTHRRELKSANTGVLSEFRTTYGRSKYRAEFDGYMTQVYNYYALPPAKYRFCDVVSQVTTDLQTVPVGGLQQFALTNLARIEAAFDGFYSDYEQYQIDVAAWDAKYGPQPTTFGTGGVGQFGPSATTPSSSVFTVDVPPSTDTTELPANGSATTAAPAPTGEPVFVSNPVVQTTPDDGGDDGGGQ